MGEAWARLRGGDAGEDGYAKGRAAQGHIGQSEGFREG